VMNPLLLAVSSSVSDLTNRVLPNLNRSDIPNTSPTVSVTRHHKLVWLSGSILLTRIVAEIRVFDA
jgi:hypothetical protein